MIFKAQGEADAILKTKKAEADGIRMVSEAKGYELEKAKQDMSAYLHLKQLDLQRELLLKWDGKLPYYFLGGSKEGGPGPGMILNLPGTEKK